jgi:hypoxanthine phosphoribosyltransferase
MNELRLSGNENFIPSAEIADRTLDLAEFYSDLYGHDDLVVLMVLKGGVRFGQNLTLAIDNPNIVEDYVRMQSMNGTERLGTPRYLIEPEENIKGRNVLVVEDIDDTRHTLSHLLPRLRDQSPKRLDLVSLFDKPEVEKAVDELPCDDIKYGFRIANSFIVGHGLDWNGRYRSMGHISVAHNTSPSGKPKFWVPIVTDEYKIAA